MNDYKIIKYDEKNIDDYKNLSQLLFYYHSGMPMENDFIYAIAQATPEQRLLAMNLSVLCEMGIHDEYGCASDGSEVKYSEKIGEALFNFYYGHRNSLTQEQLLLIAAFTDEEKLDYLERYSFSHFGNPSILDLSDRERRINMSNIRNINYDEKNIDDYKNLFEMLYMYYCGFSLNIEYLDVIAQATQKQRILAMNLSVLYKMGIHDEYGCASADWELEYSEKIGEALAQFYYGNRNSLTQEQLLLIAAFTDEEKLDYLENYARDKFGSIHKGSAICSVDLVSVERKVASSKLK